MPRSLHARMLALSAAATLVALAVAGWTFAGVLGRFVTAGLDQRLDGEVALLASTVRPDGTIDAGSLRARLGGLEDGPGWRWRIVSPDGTIGSADFPRLDEGPPGPEPRTHGHHPRPLDGRGRDGIVDHARRLTIATVRGPVEVIAAAPRDVVRRPILGALVPLLVVLGVLAALLGAATLVQLRLGLKPLRRLRDQVAAVRRGTRAGVDEDQPSELRPLALELNALMRENEAALATARLSAANLAHALKTPVAVLGLELRDDPARAAQLARIDSTIRHHLARARAEIAGRRTATLVGPAVADLVATVRQLHQGRALAIDVAVAPDDLAVAVDSSDLDEIAGNLLDNAAKHAAGRVRLSAALDHDDARRAVLVVDDDGLGIAEADRPLAARPGTRLDERGEGHGFGLGIVGDLVALYGGTTRLAASPEGGLRVVVTLPLAG